MQRLLAQATRLCAHASRQQLQHLGSATSSEGSVPVLATLWRAQCRWASDDASPPGDQPVPSGDAGTAGTEVDAAAASDEADEAASEVEEGEEDEEIDLEDYEVTGEDAARAMRQRFTFPDRPNRRPTREEKGSYIDNADLEAELDDISLDIPEGRPLYDLHEMAPGITEPRSDALEQLMAHGEAHMQELLADFGLGDSEEDDEDSSRDILRWEVRLLLDTTGQPNPVNRKAVCRVYLRELQEQTGLTDDALQHIARVAGCRYNPNKGELMLVSEQYPDRESNRLHIMETLQALVDEGERVHPSPLQHAEEEQDADDEASAAGTPEAPGGEDADLEHQAAEAVFVSAAQRA